MLDLGTEIIPVNNKIALKADYSIFTAVDIHSYNDSGS